MSKIRLYLDEDALQDGLVQALRNSGVDVITVADADRLSLSDEAQLIWSTQQQRVIYSFNMGDFNQLHRACCTSLKLRLDKGCQLFLTKKVPGDRNGTAQNPCIFLENLLEDKRSLY